MTGPQGQAQFAKRGLAQPARIAVAKGPDFAEDSQPPANKKMLNKAVDYVVFSPFHSDWREIEAKIIKPKLDLVFNGDKKASEVVEEIVTEANAILQK